MVHGNFWRTVRYSLSRRAVRWTATLLLLGSIMALPSTSFGKCARCVCRLRAQYMAHYNYRGHPPSSAYINGRYVDMNQFSGTGANFEGCGWSSGRQPGTCVPRRGARLLADETARGRNGMLYRVRLWRQ